MVQMPGKSTTKANSASTKYENNPFFIAANGLTLLFDLARGVLIFLFILALINMVTGIKTPDFSKESDRNSSTQQMAQLTSGWLPSDWALAIGAAGIVLFAVVMITALFNGVSAYTSYQLSKGERVELGEAFHIAFERLWSFLWLQVIISVKLFLWTLLFVIPGIYMSFRYSLASVAFFDEKKNFRGNAAVAESLRLTKGAWLTTYASNMLVIALSFFKYNGIVSTSVNAILYRQFSQLGSKKKPAAHWLSWLTLAAPVVIITLALIFIIALGVGIAITGGKNT